VNIDREWDRPPSISILEDLLLDDIGAFSALLARRYGAREIALRPLVPGGGKRLYRVERADRPAWLLHAAPPLASPAAFRRDALVLALLERQAYPAPRVVPTLDGAAVAECLQRPVLVTTFIEGEPTVSSAPDLGRLGETLGLLHTLPLVAPTSAEPGAPITIPPARMLPRSELAAARSWLDEVRDVVPRPIGARHDRLEAACRAFDPLEGLPTVLIHNDCHPGNSIRTPDGRVVLIDWEGAGCGSAVIDVGFLLASCEIAAFGSGRLPSGPRRVAAVVNGYCRHHRLTPQELDLLPDAIRFRAVVACAGGLRRMIREGRAGDGADWAWARYASADAIAVRARERFERHA
jgi:Ser/Thr protein kinase RdoA (MazF antagonist)